MAGGLLLGGRDADLRDRGITHSLLQQDPTHRGLVRIRTKFIQRGEHGNLARFNHGSVVDRTVNVAL